MTGEVIGLRGILGLFVLLALRMPVGLALIVAGTLVIWAMSNLSVALSTLGDETWVVFMPTMQRDSFLNISIKYRRLIFRRTTTSTCRDQFRQLAPKVRSLIQHPILEAALQLGHGLSLNPDKPIFVMS